MNSGNLLATTLIHEAEHAKQTDYYYRAMCSEKEAETQPYTEEWILKVKTGLSGSDLTDLETWYKWVTDAGPRPSTGGR